MLSKSGGEPVLTVSGPFAVSTVEGMTDAHSHAGPMVRGAFRPTRSASPLPRPQFELYAVSR